MGSSADPAIGPTPRTHAERDLARIAKFLDEVGRASTSTFERIRRIEGMMRVFPEYDWVTEIEAAADRLARRSPGVNVLDVVADTMRQQARTERRGQ